MLMRRLLVSTMICSGLMMAAPVSGEAAIGGKVFQPASSWAVSKVDGKGQSAGYCTLARRFGEGMILTFARNGNDETSLAVDFQQDVLENDRTYYVTLKPGLGEDRMFEVRPVSGKAMVIRLGQDYAFHDAMEKSGALTVDISGEPYEFRIADIAKGQAQMNGCLAALVQPAAGEPAPDSAVSTAPESDIAAGPAVNNLDDGDYKRPTNIIAAPAAPAAPVELVAAESIVPPAADAGNARNEMQNLREENLRLRNALARERRNYEDRFMQQSDSSSTMNELQEKMRLLEIENGELRARLTDNVAQSTVAAAPAQICAPQSDAQSDTAGLSETMKQELLALRDENARLKIQLADQNSRIATLEQAASNAALNAEANVRADNGAAMAEMQGRVAQLEEENAILRAKVRNNHVDAEPGRGVITLSQLRSVEAQLSAVENERDRLAAQIEDMASKKSGSLIDISGDNWDLEEATRRYNEAEREIRRLGAQLERERTQCASDKKQIEYMLFDPKIANEEQIARLTTLEEKLMQADSQLEIKTAGYKSRIESLEESLEAKDASFAETQERLSSLQNALGEKESVIRESRKQIAQLEKDLANNTLNNAEVQQKIATLTQQVTAKDRQIESVQAQLTEMTQQFASLQQEAVKTESQLQRANEKLAQAQAMADELQQRMNQQIAANRAQDETLEQAQARIAALNETQAELARANQKIAALSAQKEALEAAQQKIASLQEQNRTLQTAQKMQQRELDEDARQEVAAILAEKKRLQDRVAALESDKQELETALARIQTAAGTPRAPVAYETAQVPGAVSGAIAAEPLQPRAVDSRVVSTEPPARTAVATPAAISPAVEQATGMERAATAHLMGSADVERVLQQAGITPQGGVQAENAGPGTVAYSWDTGTLFGSAEQQAITNMGQFDSMVQAYLNKTGGRCGGEFGAVPGAMESRGDMSIASYEIACVTPDGVGATAALVFMARDGLFTAVAHETGMDSMDVAMDVRDAVYNALMQTRLAAR